MRVHMIRHMRFGKKIERLCDERGWNRAELARRIGVSKTTAGNWFDDTRHPFDFTLIKLSRALGVPVDFLVDNEMDEPPSPALSPDEAEVLNLIRALGLPKFEALRRLAGAGVGISGHGPQAQTPTTGSRVFIAHEDQAAVIDAHEAPAGLAKTGPRGTGGPVPPITSGPVVRMNEGVDMSDAIHKAGRRPAVRKPQKPGTTSESLKPREERSSGRSQLPPKRGGTGSTDK
jgi:transcriptional regulator with XRE-family HTH domain